MQSNQSYRFMTPLKLHQLLKKKRALNLRNDLNFWGIS